MAEERDGPQARYEDLIDELVGIDGVTPPRGGSGFGRGGVRFQNKIFVMFVRGRLVLKLPAIRVSELVDTGEGVHFDANKGMPMCVLTHNRLHGYLTAPNRGAHPR